MRYPRTARIFHGQVDPAPIAGVFFLVVLFLLLHSSLVFTPGIKVDLTERDELVSKASRVRWVKVDEKGQFTYSGSTMKESTFYTRLRNELSKPLPPTTLILEADPLAKPEVLARLKTTTTELGLTIKPPGTRIDLPEAENLAGTANPTIVVAVNLNGQIFFENQLTHESALRAKLNTALQQGGENLTLVLQADREVPYETLVRISAIARSAGIRDTIFATRPPLRPNSNGNNGAH